MTMIPTSDVLESCSGPLDRGAVWTFTIRSAEREPTLAELRDAWQKGSAELLQLHQALEKAEMLAFRARTRGAGRADVDRVIAERYGL